jgi:hypothetical protein
LEWVLFSIDVLYAYRRLLSNVFLAAAAITAEDSGMTIDEKVADYRRQLELEEQSQGKSSALQNDA